MTKQICRHVHSSLICMTQTKDGTTQVTSNRPHRKMSKDHEMEAVNGSLNMLKKGPT